MIEDYLPDYDDTGSIKPLQMTSVFLGSGDEFDLVYNLTNMNLSIFENQT